VVIKNKTKIGLVSAVMVLSLYGCATTKTSYPLADKARKLNQVQYCDGDDNRHLYCDDKFVYPAVVVEFR